MAVRELVDQDKELRMPALFRDYGSLNRRIWPAVVW